MIPLTKVMDQADYAQFPRGHQQILDETQALQGQHEARRWEYLMALSAVTAWLHAAHAAEETRYAPLTALDVGGAGSGFFQTLPYLHLHPDIVDPEVNWRAEEAIENGVQPADVVTCISVIEHVVDPTGLIHALADLTKPGGLLFMTCDYHDPETPDDPFHFHWMRKRIYGPQTWPAVAEMLADWGFALLGAADMDWHGPQVYDYSFASLAMVKR